MRGHIVSFLIGVHVFCASAQWDARSIGQADLLGIAGSEYWIGHGNPAVLGFTRNSFFAVSFVPSPYGLSELRRIGALFGTQMRGVGLGADVKVYGATLFRRYGFSASAALPLEERTLAGLGASLDRWTFSSYGGSSNWSISGGFVRKEAGWSLGAAATFHPAEGVGRTAAADVAAGVTIRPTDSFHISWEAEQRSGADVLFRCGMTYSFSESLAILFGWSDVVSLLSFGGALSLGGYEVSFASQHHDVLGWTHALGLSVQLSGSEITQ